MSVWSEVKLADIAVFSNGANFTKASFGTGIKIIGVSDFGDRITPQWDLVHEVDPGAVTSTRQHLRVNDLVFVRSNGNPALVGRSMLITEGPQATHSAFTIKARLDTSKVDPRFLAYQLRHAHRAGWMRSANGTNITNLNQTVLGSVPVLLPDLPIQRRIAGILGAIDDLIENNRRRIALLDEMAQAIYREWFVHFRYPGHEDDELVDSPVGPIPEGWQVERLSDLALVVMGQSPKSEHYNESGDGLPFHQGVSNFGSNYPRHRLYCRIDGRIAQAGDHLVSVRAPVGRINHADQRLVIGRGLAAVRSNRGFQALLGQQLRHVFHEEDVMGGGTIFKAITKGDLEGVVIVQPALQIARLSKTTLGHIDDLLRELTFGVRALETLRALLLPKLVTGVIDVSHLDLDEPLEASVA